MKYILYARKSTEQEERQAMSIDSQISELTQMSEKFGFKIDRIFSESMSAKKSGRPVFNEMLKYIGREKECVVLAWKVDRLTRNISDGARIIDLLENGSIKEIRTIDKVILDNSSDKFMLIMDFGVGKKYSDDLSVNVKRGNRAKLQAGGWPHRAPFGYLNDKANKLLLVDRDNAKYIVRLFNLYAQGNKSFEQISDILYSEGMRSKFGNKIKASTLHRNISNHLYYGVMFDDGKFYKGNHEPIISKQLFDKAQSILNGKIDSRSGKHFFPYRGFMTCAECGCVLTADKKKGRYVYYYCTNGKGKCEQHKKYMASKKADKLFEEVFDLIQFDPELVEIVYLASKEKLATDKNANEDLEKTIDRRLKSAQEKRSKLMDIYLDNGLSKDDYEAKTNELKLEIIDLENQKLNISKIAQNEDSTFELTKEVFLSANKAKKDFINADDDKKVKVLENLLSNLIVKDEKMASVSFKMPFEILKKSPKKVTFSEMLGMRDSNPRMHGPKPCALPLG